MPALPEHAMETAAVACIQYITPDGEMGYGVSWTGDVTLSTTIGLLELAKLKIVMGEKE